MVYQYQVSDIRYEIPLNIHRHGVLDFEDDCSPRTANEIGVGFEVKRMRLGHVLVDLGQERVGVQRCCGPRRNQTADTCTVVMPVYSGMSAVSGTFSGCSFHLLVSEAPLSQKLVR